MFISNLQGVNVPVPQTKIKPDKPDGFHKGPFSDLDTNHDGFLTMDEVQYPNQFYDKRDLNRDGLVSLKETLIATQKEISNLPQNPRKEITSQDSDTIAEKFAAILNKDSEGRFSTKPENIRNILNQTELTQNLRHEWLVNFFADKDLSVVA